MRVIGGQFRSRPLRSLRGTAMRPTTDRVREALFNILGPTIEGAVFVDVCAGTGAVAIEALSRGAAEAIFVEQHAPAVALIRQNLRSLGLQETRRAAAETVRMPDKQAGKVRTLPVKADADEADPPGPPAPSEGRGPRVEIFTLDAVKALEKLHARRFVADFFFLDPPYDAAPTYDQALEAISELRLLRRSGRVIVESQRIRTVARQERRRVPRLPAAPDGGRNRTDWSPPQRIGNLELARTARHGDTLLSFYRLALAA
jgi:16S rRNA G966 N2-methylase RsmD